MNKKGDYVENNCVLYKINFIIIIIRLYIIVHLYICIYTLKWIGPQENLFLSYFTPIHFSDILFHLHEVMICSNVPFGLYSGNCFDKVLVHFNSRICICECWFQVNCPWQIFVLFILFFFFLQECILRVCVFTWVFMSMYIYILFWGGGPLFSPLLLFSPKLSMIVDIQ